MMRTLYVAAVLVVAAMLLVGACGGGQKASVGPPTGSVFQPGWYEIRFPSARIASRRPDERPWHTSAADSGPGLFGTVLAFATGNPLLATVGEAMNTEGGDPLAPAPYVDLKLDGTTYRVSSVGTTYAPKWDQPIMLDARQRSGSERVLLQVVDQIDETVIGQVELGLAELLARPNQTLTQIASVSSLDLVAKIIPTRHAETFDVNVPGTMTLEQLATKGADKWRPVPVWNGDIVTVTACGKVCATGDQCFGPDGAEPGRWESHNVIKEARHVSLVAVTPDGSTPIGGRASFTVAQAGRVVFAVNDDDVGNNSGAFTVHVTVTPHGERVGMPKASRCF